MYASQYGDIRGMEALIDSKADVYATSARGMTALHLAVAARRIDAVRLLCEHDCEDQWLLNHANLAGKLPLDLCSDKAIRTATRNVWTASYKNDVGALKMLLFAHYKQHDKPYDYRNIEALVVANDYMNDIWPAAGLDGKTAKSGMTPLHMAIIGAIDRNKSAIAARRRDIDYHHPASQGASRVKPQLSKMDVIRRDSKRTVQFLLNNDAFVDSLDKLCR